MRSVFIAAAATSLLLCWSNAHPSLAQTQQYPHQLTKAELRDFYSNATIYALGRIGPKTYRTFFSSDGHIHINSPDFDDVGTWRIDDNGLFCTKYNKMRNAQETCQSIWQTGPNAYESHLPNGQIYKTTERVAGNPEGL
jgi:hypothetical protein